MEENSGGCPKYSVLQKINRFYDDSYMNFTEYNQQNYIEMINRFCGDFTGDFDHKIFEDFLQKYEFLYRYIVIVCYL